MKELKKILSYCIDGCEALYQLNKFKRQHPEVTDIEDNDIKKIIIKKILMIYGDNMKEEKIDQTLIRAFDELCKNENKTWFDIKYIDGGCFSNVWKIGEKVIKIGGRYCDTIPYHPRILQPMVRQRIFKILKRAKKWNRRKFK